MGLPIGITSLVPLFLVTTLLAQYVLAVGMHERESNTELARLSLYRSLTVNGLDRDIEYKVKDDVAQWIEFEARDCHDLASVILTSANLHGISEKSPQLSESEFSESAGLYCVHKVQLNAAQEIVAGPIQRLFRPVVTWLMPTPI